MQFLLGMNASDRESQNMSNEELKEWNREKFYELLLKLHELGYLINHLIGWVTAVEGKKEEELTNDDIRTIADAVIDSDAYLAVADTCKKDIWYDNRTFLASRTCMHDHTRMLTFNMALENFEEIFIKENYDVVFKLGRQQYNDECIRMGGTPDYSGK